MHLAASKQISIGAIIMISLDSVVIHSPPQSNPSITNEILTSEDARISYHTRYTLQAYLYEFASVRSQSSSSSSNINMVEHPY